MNALEQGKTTFQPAEGDATEMQAAIAMRLLIQGDEQVRAGDRQRALATYRQARDVLEGLCATIEKLEWLRALSTAHRNIAALLRADGNLAQAEDAQRSSLAIELRLTALGASPSSSSGATTPGLNSASAPGIPDDVEEILRPAPPAGAIRPPLGRARSDQAIDQPALQRQPQTSPDRTRFGGYFGALIENIPRTMRLGVLEKVEVRIAKDKIADLTEHMFGQGRVHEHAVRVADAMTVRLRAPEGGFLIDPLSPETCWTRKAKSQGLQEHDFGSWRWSVTPQRRGLTRLHLIISAQILDADGLTADATLPDQVIEVHVSVNYARTLKKVAGWGLLMIAGGALNAWGREIYPTAMALLNRFVGQ
jgi:hypothetical protein